MLKTVCLRLGGLLLVVGAVLPIVYPLAAHWVFALGAILFCPIQMTDRYRGTNLAVRRLRRQQALAALMLLIPAALMFTSFYRIPPFRGSEWKVTLFIAAVLQLYAVFRISHEEKHGRA